MSHKTLSLCLLRSLWAFAARGDLDVLFVRTLVKQTNKIINPPDEKHFLSFLFALSWVSSLLFFIRVSQVNTCFHLHGAIHHDHQQMTRAATNQTFDEEKTSLVLVSAKKYCRWNGKKMKISCCKVDDLASEVTIVFKASVPAFMTIQYIQNNFRLTYFVFGPNLASESVSGLGTLKTPGVIRSPKLSKFQLRSSIGWETALELWALLLH